MQEPVPSQRERKKQRKLERKAEWTRQQNQGQIQKRLIILAVIVVAVGSMYWIFSSTPHNLNVYPPTDVEGHIESYPPQRISRQPIPIAVQKHILEHTPARRPGIILQYNCQKFACEPELIENLTAIAQSDNHVYLAPYPSMAAKIAVTALGKLETLEQYDEEKIKIFIAGN